VNVLNKQELPAKAFKKQHTDRKMTEKFITMDIETINNNGKLIPYLICGYNGSDYITSYGLDQQALFSTFINQLLSKEISKSNKLTVYAHNLSGFDGIFLMKYLLPFGKVEPLLFNGKLFSIKVKTNTGKTIQFKDSYLLLPLSLRKLCKAFDVTVPKSYFPFNLTNINYVGVFPQFDLWTGITQTLYDSLKLKYKKSMWSFKEESVKYCKLDCKSLHQVLVKFNELVFNEFNLDIHTPLTLPSLAMKIYKTHYMPKDSIYQLVGEVEQNIRQSYSGGAVDVYIPHNKIGKLSKKLYYFDVNSLYPAVMSKLDMPIGKPVAFEGDIRKMEPEAYGFFYCKITTPEYLKHPILQRRIRGKGTVAGLGNWLGWISSVELDNAVQYGYTFEILKGYQFEKGNLFKDYVNKMYNLRLKYDKGSAMNLIAKLLMNSLYGKFGMKMETSRVDIYDKTTEIGQEIFRNALSNYGETVQDYIKIDNNFLIIRNTRLTLKYDEEADKYHGQDVNIAIASAITSYARVHMSLFKNNPNFNLYYSDTERLVNISIIV
jgi:hypothetical protein